MYRRVSRNQPGDLGLDLITQPALGRILNGSFELAIAWESCFQDVLSNRARVTVGEGLIPFKRNARVQL